MSLGASLRALRLEERANAAAQDALGPKEELVAVVAARRSVVPGPAPTSRHPWIIVLTNHRLLVLRLYGLTATHAALEFGFGSGVAVLTGLEVNFAFETSIFVASF